MTLPAVSEPPSPRPPASPRGGADRRVAALTQLLSDGLRAAPAPPQGGALRVPAAARAAYLAARRSLLPAAAPMVVVARTEEEAHCLADDLAAWLPAGELRVLRERGALQLERALP